MIRQAPTSTLFPYTTLFRSHGLLFFDSWLRLVTTHELAHVFHLDRSRGLWDGLQRAVEVKHVRSEEHTSELQSRQNLVCRLLLGNNKNRSQTSRSISAAGTS